MSNDKASIAVYLSSSPAFLLELLYTCIINVLLTFFIFCIHEKIKFLRAKRSNWVLPIKQFKDKNNLVRRVLQNNIKNIKQRKVDETKDCITTTQTADPRWSKEESATTQGSFTSFTSKTVRQRTKKDTRLPSQPGYAGDCLIQPQPLIPPPPQQRSSSHIDKYHRHHHYTNENCGSSCDEDLFDDCSPEDYESYVLSMTSIWNNLFDKSKVPSSASAATVVVANANTTTNLLQQQNCDSALLLNESTPDCQYSMFHNGHNVNKTDSVLAVRGSNSEINFHSFTDSEIKILERPIKESIDSLFSQCYSNVHLGDHQSSCNLDSKFLVDQQTIKHHTMPLTSTPRTNLTLRDSSEKKKSNFDIILEEK